jgi:signal recognition particle subunit SRP54
MARRMAKGKFDLDDLAGQIDQMKKMGGLSGLMGMLPGVGKMKAAMAADNGAGDKMLDRQRAIINSMTKEERKKPDLLAASRKRRIAAGAGVDVAEINRLLKQHRQMADTFKSMAKDGGRSFARMAQMMGMGGGAAPGGPAIPPALGGSMPDMEQLKALGGGKMPDLGQLSKLTGGPGGLPGLGNLPPGFNPFKKN